MISAWRSIPEFLREGVAVADFYAPPKTVIGASDLRTEQIVSRIYGAVDKKIQFTSIAAAEMVKYVDNVWHATKVAFGNEVGRLCKSLNIDSHDVMNIFVTDTKLNLSPYYLKPGLCVRWVVSAERSARGSAFGGNAKG